MKKTYLEPETKLYAMHVEGFLAGESNITAGTTDPQQGGDPTHPNNNTNNPFQSSAKTEREWDI
ncbi:aminotransferase [Prevotella jejuni]